MRKLRTLRFIISAVFLTVFISSFAQSPVAANRNNQNGNNQNRNTPAPALRDTAKQKGPRHHYPLFNGVVVGVNIADPVLRLFGQDYGAYEGCVEVNLHNRFFPEWSFGVGSAETTTDAGIYYKTKPAFFTRVGMNYNFRYNSPSSDYFVVGLRYGVSSYSADIRNMTVNDGYWDPIENVSLPEQKFTSHWLEFTGGIRVQVLRNLSMGWNIHVKAFLKKGNTENASPWYVPGYGVNGKGFGISYNIYYQLPFGGKKNNPITEKNTSK